MMFLLLTASAAFSQGPRGPFGSVAPGQNTGLDMAKATVVEGTVTAVNIASGTQYPSITVGTMQIKVAPVWYLLDSDFEVAAGMTLQVKAAPSLMTSDSYLHAIEMTNVKLGSIVVLRNADGVPLWRSPRGSRFQEAAPPRAAMSCVVDPASVRTESGIVDRITAGVRIQMPLLVLKMSDGRLVTVKIGPERLLLDNDFEAAAGDRLTVLYAAAPCADEFIALQLIDGAGHKVILRNDDGSPAWR